MKNVTIALVFGLFLSSTPALAATTSSCDGLTTVKHAACMRVRERSNGLKSGTTSVYIQKNIRTLQEVRRNRRSDAQDRNGITRSNVRNREMQTADLRLRRLATLQRQNDRLSQRKERKAVNEKNRQNLLRNRILDQAKTSTRGKVLSKEALRSRSRMQDSTAQTRRKAVQKAHAKCRTLGVGERLQCLADERKKEL